MKEHVHFVGIGGTGLSAIARVLHEQGVVVSGSDRALGPLAVNLQNEGIPVKERHQAANINGATLVVRSSAIPDDNIEVQTALDKGLPVLKRSDYLGQLMRDHTGIAVAGTHGKTTTTAMLAWLFTAARKDPTYIVGGVVTNLGTNAAAGHSPYFIIEADEYDHMFWGLNPTCAVITNVEHDHPDCFPTPESFDLAFDGFVQRVVPNGSLVYCQDDAGAARLVARTAREDLKMISYGIQDGADFHARHLDAVPGAGFAFDIYSQNGRQASLRLRVPGRHNVLNALAAFVVGTHHGLSAADLTFALDAFRGAGRRFEVRGEEAGVTIVDDYAHHPTEIAVTIQAARDRYPDRPLIVVWQPHTFSRFNLLEHEFGIALAAADAVYVTDVFAAREQTPAGFSMDALLETTGREKTQHVSGLQVLAEQLVAVMVPGDVLVVLSAGDADQISKWVLEGLRDADGIHTEASNDQA